MGSNCILPSRALYVIRAKVKVSGILSHSVIINRLVDTTGFSLYLLIHLLLLSCQPLFALILASLWFSGLHALSCPKPQFTPFSLLMYLLFLQLSVNIHLLSESSLTMFSNLRLPGWFLFRKPAFPFVFFVSLHLWTSWLIYLFVVCLLNVYEKF